MKLKHCWEITFLTMVFYLVIAPQAAWGATDEKYFTFKSGVITDYTGTEAVVEIPATIGGVAVKEIGFRAFANNTTLTSVTIPSSVTIIGNFAFKGCNGLVDITIPSNVTTIGGNAFLECKGLTSVTILSNAGTIGDYAFSGCTSLTSVKLSSGVTSIGTSAFSSCGSLTSITIPSGVTSIGDFAFRWCNKLNYVTIEPGVTTIGESAFQNCSRLISITIPHTVTAIGSQAFSGCNYLVSIIIPSGVTTIEPYTFDSCTKLTSVTIPESVTTIKEYAFNGCISLPNVTIPSSVTQIEINAFCSCQMLEKVYFQGNAPATLGEDIFKDTKAGLTIYYLKGKTGFDTAALSSYPKYYYNLKVTYDGNGSTAGAAPTYGTSFDGNTQVTVLTNGELVKDGFDFVGWNTKTDGSGTDYKANDTFIIMDDIVLYAQWENPAPILSVSPTFLKPGTVITATSNETGKIYLVPQGNCPDPANPDAVIAEQILTVTANTAVSITTEGLRDGCYQLYAIDNYGGLSVATDITIDSIAPTIIFINPPETSTSVKLNPNNGSMVIVQVLDSLSGIDKENIRLQLDDGEWVKPAAVYGNTVYFLLSSVGDGDHNLHVKVWDRAGNETIKKISFEWDHYRRGFGFGRFRF